MTISAGSGKEWVVDGSEGSAGGVAACRRCGRPIDRPSEVVSHHRTSEGEVVYSRCVCGMLQVWLGARPVGPARLVTRSGDLPVSA